MLMTTEHRDVKLVGGDTSTRRKFTFKVSGEMFRSQIAGIYSDRIMAPVREYSTNAYDAHIRANKKDVPFDVTAPTQLEPVFKVRDYGLGLSEEAVLIKYTCIGETDKNASNNEVGGLGLGCKSAFAYTSQFTLTSWHDGFKTIYSLFLAEDGIPEIQKISAMPTNEPTGMEILIPVKIPDIPNFQRAFNDVFQGFDPLPKLRNTAFKFAFPEVMTKGADWKIVNDNKGPRARQGCVIYPINKQAIQVYGNIYDLSIIVDFPIGALSIATNREALGNDERTRAAIKNRFYVVQKEITASLQKQIDGCKTFIDACKLQKNTDYYTPDGKLWHHFGNGLKWNGRDLILTLSSQTSDNVSPISNKVLNAPYPCPTHVARAFHIQVNNWDKTLFIYDDAPNFSISRLRVVIEEKRDDYPWIFWYRGSDFQGLLAKFENPAHVKLSDYQPVKVPRARRVDSVKMPTTYIKGGEIRNAVSLDVNSGGIYVTKSGNSSYVINGTTYDHYAVQAHIRSLTDAKIIDSHQTIWCFTDVKHKKLKENPIWQSLDDAIRDGLKARVKQDNIVKEESFKQLPHDAVAKFCVEQTNLSFPKEIREFVDEFRVAQKQIVSTPTDLLKLYEEYFPGDLAKLQHKTHPLFSKLEVIKNRWPMLKVLAAHMSYWQKLDADNATIVNNYLRS